jgi:hypothetical protein
MIEVDNSGHWVIGPNTDSPVRTNHDGRWIMGGKVWRIVVLRGLAPNDDRTPEGVLVRHFDTWRIGAQVGKYIGSTFEAGVPAGVLKVSTPNMSDDEANALKASWTKAHGHGKRSIAVLSSTVDFTKIGMTPIDAGADSMLRTNNREIALAFNLDPIWVGEGAGGLTYNNNSDRRRDLVDVSLANWTESLTAVLSSILPFGHKVEVEWTTFTSPSLEALVPPLVAAVDSGILTAAEARGYLGITVHEGPDPAWQETSSASSATTPAIEGAPA